MTNGQRLRYIYISPHLDDAVLSCGGSIAAQAAAGADVVIATLFTRDPDLAACSDLAVALHARWGDPEHPYAPRRAEDIAAAELLGARAIHLALPDAIYRNGSGGAPFYPDEAAVFGPLHPADQEVVGALKATLEQLVVKPEPVMLCFPLSVGGHVDHRLTFQASRVLAGRRLPHVRLCYYEDFPYAAGLAPKHAPESVLAALRRLGCQGWASTVLPVDPAPRIDASACYLTQIPGLFGDRTALAQAVTAYASSVSETHPYAERFWQAGL